MRQVDPDGFLRLHTATLKLGRKGFNVGSKLAVSGGVGRVNDADQVFGDWVWLGSGSEGVVADEGG